MTEDDQIYSLPTDIGAAKLSYALSTNGSVNIVGMAIGDGAGSLVSPESDWESLTNEVYRAQLNRLYQHEENPQWLVAELVLPAEVGGWTIRELMLYDDEGNALFVGNHAEQYKPAQSQGSDETKTIRMVILVSDTSVVQLKTDPSVVLAMRSEVLSGDQTTAEAASQALAEHAAGRNHPAATTSAQGMVEFADQAEHLSGSRGDRAATPSGVKSALDARASITGFKLTIIDGMLAMEKT